MLLNKDISTKDIIKKWYLKLPFDRKYDQEFYEILEKIPIEKETCIDHYDLNNENGQENLLSFLYMCEKLQEQYDIHGVCEDILQDTLEDIVRWSEIWSEIKGYLCLGELNWLSKHMSFQLFKLGRLQFCFNKTGEEYPALGLQKGETYVDIHIPAVGPLNIDQCHASIEAAKSFFEAIFPDVKFTYFGCHSWLLDESLKNFLPNGSNILQFAKLFQKVHHEKSDDILRYVFTWDTTRKNLREKNCTSKFAEEVKEHVLNGETFYICQGFFQA